MHNSTHRRQFSKLSLAAVSATVGAALLASAIPASAAPATEPSDSAARAAAVVESATGTADIAASMAAPGTPARAVTATDGAALTVIAPEKADGALQAADDNGSSFGLTLPGAKDVVGVKAGSGTVVYPDAAAATDIAVQPTKDGGARALVTLKDDKAAGTHRFRLNLPQDASITEDGQGGFEITREAGEGIHVPVATIDAPWAKDAHGKSVPTSYKLDGTDLIQTIETGEETAFPVVADPKMTWGIVTGTAYFNKKETKAIANNGALSGVVSGFLPPGLNIYWGAHAAVITTTALKAKNAKKCIKVKFAAGIFIPGQYSGGHCK
ncbi:hypothetical protein ABZ916_23515 [Streptomyces sp. NPDC046853]|uniref:hypothetical protein n=1 Tax=Streptomyces sp. NPDC046853 TaxID=3154920 RepID=UPI0033F145EC